MRIFVIYLLLFLTFFGYAQDEVRTPKQIANEAIESFHAEQDEARKLLILEKAESELLTQIDDWETVQKNGAHKYMTLDPKGMYDATYTAWKETFEKKKYRKLLKALAEGDTDVLTKKNIKFINKYRRQTHFLRMSFNMFDVNHRPPAGLKKFVVHSGKLKDIIALSKKSNYTKKVGALKKKAQMLLDLYDDVDLKAEAKSISFITQDEFHKYFKSMSDDIVHDLSSESLTVREFHEVRKKIKEIQFALKDIIDNSPERADLLEVFDRIDQVRSEMGDVHSMYIDLKITGDIEYEKHTIKMAKEYKEAMESLVKVGESNICSVKFDNLSKLIK